MKYVQNNTMQKHSLNFLKIFLAVVFCLTLFSSEMFAQQENSVAAAKQSTPSSKKIRKINKKVWSISYWQRLAEEGLVEVTTEQPDRKPIYTSSEIKSESVVTADSPDVAIINSSTITQSENSVFIDPLNSSNVLNSNNSSNWPVSQLDVSEFTSTNNGGTWNGIVHFTGRADPATAIDRNGRYYVGYVAQNTGQGVSWSANRGATWNDVQIAAGPGGNDLLDKNHLWVDNSATSPHEGNLYSAWTRFEPGHPNDNEIEVSRSTDGGLNWSAPINISTGVNADIANQGVNIQTAPNGDVYAVWMVNDRDWLIFEHERALGFSRSTDGGVTWSAARRIIDNIEGIRYEDLGGNKTMRHNSFPSMTVDSNGNIYVVWTNQGVPGQNNGDPDIYMIRSTDGGNNWSAPVRVNQDQSGNGRDQWFPWIAADPASGDLVCIFYDSRNFANNDMAETYVALSRNQGMTWEDFKVSDFAWAADGIPGYGENYAGDYLGIDIQSGRVYPVWSDDRSGNTLTYTSFFQTQFTLNVSKSGNGRITSVPSGIDCGGDCSEKYLSGTSVDMFAVGDPGWSFVRWGGACSGDVCKVTMNGDKTVTAEFTPIQPQNYTLTTNKTGHGNGIDGRIVSSPGGIYCGLDCSENYSSGTGVDLRIENLIPGSRFVGWSGDCNGAQCHLTMNGNKTVTAEFAPAITYSLSVDVNNGTGTGTVRGTGINCEPDCSENYSPNTWVTLSASASNDSIFAGWSGDCSGLSSNCTVLMDRNRSAIAIFNRYNPGNFSDDPIQPGVTEVKDDHIWELRNTINNLRAAYGLGNFNFTDPNLDTGDMVRAVHIRELRSALDGVYNYLGRTHSPYTDPELPSGTEIKADHINQIRVNFRAVQN